MAGSNTKPENKPAVKPKRKVTPKKKPKRKNKPGAGRPTKKDAEVVGKLIAGFNNGFNDSEACSYAGIARDTFYSWRKNDKQFSDKIAVAQEYPNKKAKEVVLDGINAGNSSDAKWWLERRDKEFKAKGELEHKGEVPVAVVRFIGGKHGTKKRS